MRSALYSLVPTCAAAFMAILLAAGCQQQPPASPGDAGPFKQVTVSITGMN
jgi:hypothetical protein